MKCYNYFLIVISAGLLIFMSMFLLSNTDVATTAQDDNPRVKTFNNSVVPPGEVEFCNKKISLDRIDLRERYDRELNAFVYLHSSTMMLIKKANRYFPIIEPILKKNNIPDDFKYLATIESNLDIRALSLSKAAGIWQFMPDAGKSYGLEVGNYVDERYHIEKATEAACRYLKTAYNKYGDWATVAASYNAGMGRISSELESQNVDQAFDLLLVEETSRYVFRILAAKEIFSNPQKYGFLLKKESLYNPVKTKNVEVSEDITDIAAFAGKYDLNYAQIKEFNPWLRDKKLVITKGKSYLIAIPEKDDLYYSKTKVKVHNEAWVVD